jgi:hypothetical protein
MSQLKRARTEESVDEMIDSKLYSLIRDLEIKNSNYYNFDKIKDDFIKLLEEHSEGMMNKCLECGTDMGRSNPRQLCGKTYCYYGGLDDVSESESQPDSIS